MATDGEKRPAEEIELTEDQVDAWLSANGQKRVQVEESAPAADVDAEGDVEVADAPAAPAIARQGSSVAERTRSNRPVPKNYIAGAQESVQKKLLTNFRGYSDYGADAIFGGPAGAENAPAESAEERLARIETEAAELQAQIAAREAEKAAAAAEGGAESDEEESPEDEYEDNNSDDGEVVDEEPAFEPLADGSTVAVAYGSVFSKNRRRWFAATVVAYNEGRKKYIVKWKSVPKGGRPTFLADSGRVKAVSKDDYDAAPEDGVSFIGFHRQSTFAAPSDDQDLKVGDPVAVAYGGQRTVAGVAGKFLWYTARIVGVSDDKYTVQWKFPASKDRAQFEANKDKVQPITETEYSKARKNRGKKVVYGFIGYRRMESAANLSAISTGKTDA